MKIVVLDGYTTNPGDLSWDELKQLGDVTIYDRVTSDPSETDLILRHIGDAEVVFTNKTPMTRALIEQLPNLRFISVMATGFNTVDVDAAKERGILVSNIPIYGTAAVAQTAFALLLELCHQVGVHNEAVKAGEWTNCPDYSFWKNPLVELDGQTLGIIGMGRIGKRSAKIGQAMGMNILAYDMYEDQSIVSDTLKYVNLDELLENSDVIFMHCPQTAENTGMINKETIAKMKTGVFFVNNSRGGLVVEKDLSDAINSGKIAGAAVDVVSVEPIPADNYLLNTKNCIVTPHFSWAPRASRERLLKTAVNNVRAFQNGKPENIVNE